VLPGKGALLFMAVMSGADGAAGSAGELARQTLARELGIGPDAVRVVTVSAAEWPDTSLGCPSQGTQVLPVVTSGHRVVLEARGSTYELHVAGSRAVLCAGSFAEPRIMTATRLADLARRDLATRLGVDPAGVKTASVQPRSWPDASLGCPKPGMSYAQVVTPGFLIELEAGGKTYRYHSDRKRIVPCD
jgi:hypothetical protein